MSVSTAQDEDLMTMPLARKRKRNNSSVSLPDGIIPPLSTPIASPTQREAAQFQRLATPPLHISRPSSAHAITPTQLPSSPVAARSLGPELSRSGSQSPRTVVAKRLSTLDLSKYEPETNSDWTSNEVQVLKDGQKDSDEQEARSAPLEDTAQEKQPQKMSDQGASASGQPPKKRLPPPRGIKSPPPKGCKPIAPKQTDIDQPPSSISLETTTQPASDVPSSSPSDTQSTTKSPSELVALTWQDSEITGHLMLDPEDDGYGINGIGFKPTPAMANARSQRRKQQLTAWRTREEREERERRAERRRQGRAMYSTSSDFMTPIPTLNLSTMTESMDKKMVRFAV